MRKRVGCSCVSAARETGFSVVELMVVMSVTIVLAGISVYKLAPVKRAMGPEDTADQVENFLRDAYHRAVADRTTTRVTINRANQLITIENMNPRTTGIPVEMRRDSLNPYVTIEQPVIGSNTIATPAAPYNYPKAVFTSNVWQARFFSDGSVLDANGNPLSATLFFAPSDLGTDANLIRAVTLFAPTGSIRLWKYNGTSFSAGGN